MFKLFLTWPQIPLVVEVTVLTSEIGAGNAIGTIARKNTEVLVQAEKSQL